MTVDAGQRPSLTVASGLLGLSSIASRLATLVVMALLARGAGAEAVGHYGLATLSASFTAAALSFGLVTHLTREAAAGRVPADEVARLHAGRLVLFALVVLLAWPVTAVALDPAVRGALLLFFAASLLEQWNETAWVLVRGTGRAWREAAVNGGAGAVLVAGCALAALHGGLTLDRAAVLVLTAAVVRSGAALAATGAWRVRPATVRGAGAAARLAALFRRRPPRAGLLPRRRVRAGAVRHRGRGRFVRRRGRHRRPGGAGRGVDGRRSAGVRGPPRRHATPATNPRAIYRFFRLAGTAAAGVLLVALPVGVTVLFGSAPEVLTLTAVLGLFLALRFANYGLSAILLAGGRAGSRLLVLVYSVGGNVLLNLLLDGTYGAAGAAWATVLTELVVAGSMLWFIHDRALLRPVLAGIAMVAAAATVLVVVGRFGTTAAVLTTGVLLLGLAAAQALRHPRSRPGGGAMRIGIAGWFGSDNLGDEILLHSLMGAVRAAAPDAGFVVLCPEPDRVTELHGVDAIHLPTLRARGSAGRQGVGPTSALRGCDLLLLGPGTIFQERSPNLPWPGTLPMFARLVAMARLAGTPVAIAGAGVREGGTAAGRRLLRVIGAGCAAVGVRDARSAALFRPLAHG